MNKEKINDKKQADLEYWIMHYQVDELDHFRASVICMATDGKLNHEESLEVAKHIRLRDAARGMAMPVNAMDTQRMTNALNIWPIPKDNAVNRIWLYGFIKAWLVSHEQYEDEDDK